MGAWSKEGCVVVVTGIYLAQQTEYHPMWNPSLYSEGEAITTHTVTHIHTPYIHICTYAHTYIHTYTHAYTHTDLW